MKTNETVLNCNIYICTANSSNNMPHSIISAIVLPAFIIRTFMFCVYVSLGRNMIQYAIHTATYEPMHTPYNQYNHVFGVKLDLKAYRVVQMY